MFLLWWGGFCLYETACLAIHHRKNNTALVLPGGAAVAGAKGFVGRLSAAPPGNSNPKANTTRTPGMMKKLLALPLVAPL
ncbi:hypothetical protein ACVGWI_05670, partial [Enterobacter hormaechei]